MLLIGLHNSEESKKEIEELFSSMARHVRLSRKSVGIKSFSY